MPSSFYLKSWQPVFLHRLNVFAVIVLCVSAQRYDSQKHLEEPSFAYSNCNRSAVPLFVKNLQISPDPISFGDNITVKLDVILQRDAGANHNRIEVDLSLRLKTEDGYTELCDIVGEEACHYNDVCAIIAEYMENRKCPLEPLTNCSCPFENEHYNFPSITFKSDPLPFGLRGTFNLTMNIHEQGKYLGCVDVHFCVTDCEPLGSKRTKITNVSTNP